MTIDQLRYALDQLRTMLDCQMDLIQILKERQVVTEKRLARLEAEADKSSDTTQPWVQ